MNITVLGAGAWGTACAKLLAEKGHSVTLWCHEEVVETIIKNKKENTLFLPGVTLPANVLPTTSLQKALNNDLIFEAIPVTYLRAIAEQAAPFYRPEQLWVILSKGIEAETMLLPSEILQSVLGSQAHFAVLSGPSFALETAQNEPTIVTIAAPKESFSRKVKEAIETPHFRCVTSSDFLGTQVAGALKNVIALGSGLIAGAEYHANTQVFFLLAAMKELTPLIEAMGGETQTLYGPAGVGDLILSCFGKKSRNYSYGFCVGEALKTAKNCTDVRLQEADATVEGLNTLKSIEALTNKHTLQLPLCSTLSQLFFKHQSIELLISTLSKTVK